ncbi:hypothetical protein ACJMK2_040706, partial [Sinanodonta woodiana]
MGVKPTLSWVLCCFCIVYCLQFGYVAHGLNNLENDERELFEYGEYLRNPFSKVDSKKKIERLGAVLKGHIKELRMSTNKQIDLIFLVDSSTSVGKNNFIEEVKFVKKLLSDFTVDTNHTRVSVITFASRERVTRQIDYLNDETSRDRHKCSLLVEDLPKITYSGGGTFTLGAFIEAKRVLNNARPKAQKVVILVTDGFSNGGDPRPQAAALKEEGVKIFTFGIQNVNVRELYEMASEPKNEFCYILDSFEEFKALTRRALHEDLNSGRYIPQAMEKCDRLCDGGECCDPNASCLCGIHTGKYECVCPPGHYGNGLKGRCQPCPAGTYKEDNKVGDINTCKHCPDENHSTDPGAISPDQCVCKKGYRDYDGTGCKMLTCPQLTAPSMGYFVNGHCNNVFNAACGLRCKAGYGLRGSSLRICQEKGTWTGLETECVMKTCPALKIPKNGNMICSADDFSFNTTCQFTCDTGYKLVGARKRKCLAVPYWTGITTRCRVNTCQALPVIRDGSIYPAVCRENDEVSHGTTCSITCRSGYTLIGPHSRQCLPNGMWTPSMTTEVSQCVDYQPPRIDRCHSPLPVVSPEQYANVSWEEPLFSDNSGQEVIVERSHSPGLFSTGKTIVTYIAHDKSGNNSTCTIEINVIQLNRIRVVIGHKKRNTRRVKRSDNYKFEKLEPRGQVMDGSVTFDFNLEGSVSTTGNPQVDNQRQHMLVTTFKRAIESLKDDAKQGHFNLEISGKQLKLVDISFMSQELKFMCKPGSVLINISCVHCPVGAFFNLVSKQCESCPKGTFQPQEGQISCLICPNKTSTTSQMSRSREQCKVLCLPGSFSETGLDMCETCHLGFYQSGYGQKECIPCPVNTTTIQRGSRKKELCQKECEPGYVSKTGLEPCFPCPKGSYQDGKGKKSCFECPGSVNTYGTASTSLFNCEGYQEIQRDSLQGELLANECLDNPCKNGGTCYLKSFGFECECPPGYAGGFCDIDVDDCEWNPCLNEAKCRDLLNDYLCDCLTGYEGKECEKNIDDCKDQPCQSGGTCIDQVNGYICRCENGFSGQTCEININDCLENPCANGGTCIDETAGYRCVCPSGLQGINCEINNDECVSGPCLNGGTCADGIGNFSCSCPPGFQGRSCEIDINECALDPCGKRGKCEDLPGGFKCHCPTGFKGKDCAEEIDIYFQLDFPSTASTTDYAMVPMRKDLTVASLCFWMKSDDTLNQGTPFSYASPDGIDNAFTLTDYDGFAFYVNGAKVSTSVKANDGLWHHICVIWSSERGTWKIYMDGGPLDDGHDLANGQTIKGGGEFIIGQEQDSLGGDFSSVESFIGQLTQLNMWDYELPLTEIESLRMSCNKKLGNVIAWSDVTSTMKGSLSDSPAEFCKECPIPSTPVFGKVVYNGLTAGSTVNYECLRGFHLSGPDKRLCLVTGEWEEVEPTCQRAHCGYPGNIENGYFTGQEFTFDNRVIYKCNNGFRLVGSSTRYCNEAGVWVEPAPVCKLTCTNCVTFFLLRIMCVLPSLSENTRITNPQTTPYLLVQQALFECIAWNNMYSDHKSIGCQTDGTWDKSIPSCDPQTCRKSPTDINSQISEDLKEFPVANLPECVIIECPVPQNFPNADLILYSCQEGCRIQGQDLLQCFEDGNWIPNPLESNGFTFQEVSRFQCDIGYKLVGPSERQCLQNGSWSGESPVCKPISCLKPDAIEHGRVTGRDFPLGKSITYVCDEGYMLVGISERFCRETVKWQNDPPSCIRLECGPPPNNNHLFYIANSFFYGDTVEYQCEDGYKLGVQAVVTCAATNEWFPFTVSSHISLVRDLHQYKMEMLLYMEPILTTALHAGDAYQTCAINEMWSGSAPRCEAVKFFPPILVANGRKDYKDLKFEIRRCLANLSWSEAEPQCVPVACDAPPKISFGQKLVTGLTYQSTVTYSCENGYVLKGEGTLTSIISNGRMIGNIFAHDATIYYACDEGYRVLGSVERTCQASGERNNPIPFYEIVNCAPPKLTNGFSSGFQTVLDGSCIRTCQANDQWSAEETVWKVRLDCDKLQPPVNEQVLVLRGKVRLDCDKLQPSVNGQVWFSEGRQVISYDGFYLVGLQERECQDDQRWSGQYPLSIKYSCNHGFELKGDNIQICMAKKRWTGSNLTCQKISCGVPSAIKFGSYTGDKFSFGDTVEFVCNEGYQVMGESRRICQQDKLWSDTDPISAPIYCGPIPASDFGTEIVLQCDEGFQVAGRCKIQGFYTWYWNSDEAPQCVKITCKEISFLEIMYFCDELYELVGPSKRVCTNDGNWSGVDPFCTLISCSAPPVVPNSLAVDLSQYDFSDVIQYVCYTGYTLVGNGSLLCSEYTFGNVVTYICDKGYLLSGERMHECEADSRWSGKGQICTPIACGTTPTVHHTFKSDTGKYFKSTAFYIFNGAWMDSLPKCIEVKCGPPLVLPHSTTLTEQFTFRSVATYKLDAVQQWEYDASIECCPFDCGRPTAMPHTLVTLENTEYGSTAVYSCEKGYIRLECGPPPNNDHLFYIGNSFFYGDSVEYQCEDGYKLGVQAVVTCAATNEWFPFTSTVTYSCENGYVLKGEGTLTCQTYEINNIDCLENPCVNDGTCIDEAAGYRCVCPSGLQGINCEINNDECASGPCLNGGTCADGIGNFSCSCPPGFQGRSCEIDINECALDPCGKGGKCEDLPGGFKCHCPTGFKGKDCAEEIDIYFQLDFPSTVSTTDYAKVPMRKDLTAASLCFWMKSDDTLNQGTPFSYASPDGIDNAFTLTDYDGFAFYVNGANVSTSVKANDGLWHHICVIWSSERGTWKIYMDGGPLDDGHDLANGQTIKGGGEFIIGQEQDSLGGDFSSVESFIGQLTQLNMWDYELPLTEIESLRLSCNKKLGNVIAWSDVTSTMKGSLSDSPAEFCKECPIPSTPVFGKVVYNGLTAGSTVNYECLRGFHLSGPDKRLCLVTGEWEEVEPTCQRVHCGYPGNIENGYFTGQEFTFDNRVIYKCNNGFRLVGSSTRYCNEAGVWVEPAPVCKRQTYEINIIDCLENPCVNDGTCIDEAAGYRCVCPSGLQGINCEINNDECASGPCLNGGTCADGIRNFSCSCPPGFQGRSCEIDINECALDPCGKGGKCEDLPGGFKCHCPTGFKGKDCVEEIDIYFQLDFPSTASTTDYAKVPMRKDLTAATLCFWMKSDDTLNQGTPFSYASPDGIDNAFTLTDYDGFAFYVNGAKVSTSVKANNGLWHHICVIWSSKRGTWKIYMDGGPLDDGHDLANGQTIKGGGEFIIGQEQDSLGGDFSSVESFIGQLTQLNMWDYELPLTEIESLRMSCNKKLGNVIAWSDVTSTMKGSLSDSPAEFCKECPIPSTPVFGKVVYNGLTAGSTVNYECLRGFHLSGPDKRLCLVSGEWEEVEPTCQRAQCGYPENIENGYFTGQEFTFDNRVIYKCNNGFRLVGSSTRYCNEAGVWVEPAPVCKRQTYEINIIDCLENPCVNDGTCIDETAGYRCVCPSGLQGINCEINNDECASGPCLNGGTCADGIGNYSCSCPSGFQGRSCEIDINECALDPCGKGGKCEDLPGGFKCHCPTGFKGKDCAEEIDIYFQLDFPSTASTTDYAKVPMRKDLTAATLCFWMKSDDTLNQGTPFSYASPDGIDNAFTLTDYDGFAFYVNGAKVSTSVKANDGLWHHICVIWSSERGTWKIYMDGGPLDDGHYLANGQTIKGGGEFIIGQEQDSLGGDFSSDESFIGQLTQLNMWDYELPLTEIESLRLSCKKKLGNVIAWLDVTSAMKGSLSDSPAEFCKECPIPSTPAFGKVVCNGLTAGSTVNYECLRGFHLSGPDKRLCLVTGEWEEVEPTCQRAQCGYPGNIENGYFTGQEFTFDNQVIYKCNNGFRLVGSSTRYCNEAGVWVEPAPVCK